MQSHDFSFIYFLVCNSSLQILTSTQAMKLKFGIINLVKGQCVIYRPEYVFSHMNKLIKS